MKSVSEIHEQNFYSWMESVRKDVECAFGILKKRWRVLKLPMRVRRKYNAENIFTTCCILHNMLLDDAEEQRAAPLSGSFNDDEDNQTNCQVSDGIAQV